MNQYLVYFLKTVLKVSACCLITLVAFAQLHAQSTVSRNGSYKIGNHQVDLYYPDSTKAVIIFYNEHIFRIYKDMKGGDPQDPYPQPPAKIFLQTVLPASFTPKVSEEENVVTILSDAVKIIWHKTKQLFTVYNLKTNHIAFEEVLPLQFAHQRVSQVLKENREEYFFGGGAQNGRFSHKGNLIKIVNENNWEDGGVSSPNPFYWSTNGYGVIRNTFEKGYYDFGKEKKGVATLTHTGNVFDAWYFINDSPEALLKDYYYLTGNPVLLPKFGFYQGHLNAYNRDYWAEVDENTNGAIKFKDGKWYKEYNPVAETFADESQQYERRRAAYEKTMKAYKDKYGKELEGQYRESLNPEISPNGKNNYPFTAHAAVDRYFENDMPLGWILPNDGYGAGYGQTSTLQGNVENLKKFGEYARSKGVQIGLWTQSNLETESRKDIHPLLQRSLTKEIGIAGVRVLKTDVAWVGAGYSFGLNGIREAAKRFPEYGQNARPFIITLDGWAGSQRYGAFWTGDETGGKWSYIDFEIPTYIGEGLSGQPNMGSDMDGIFGGKNPVVNTRDFQWKTFTPMELNMDGWGANPKYPDALGEPVTSINRTYLKLKSALLPYTYSVAHNAVNGLPIIRAMFLEDKNEFTLGTGTRYQYMYGPYFLVAPIYKNTRSDSAGNDIRNHIYLPEGYWIDYFTGEMYEGGRIMNEFAAPLWKLPVFIKNGAIIPMTKANNTPEEIDDSLRMYDVYPMGKSDFTEYDDDGKTESYKNGAFTTTKISADGPAAGLKGTVKVVVEKTTGNFNGFQNMKRTVFRIAATEYPAAVEVTIGNRPVVLKAVNTKQEFEHETNAYFYEANPNLNEYATKGSSFANISIDHTPFLHLKIEAVDVTKNDIQMVIKGFINKPPYYSKIRNLAGSIKAPRPTVAAVSHDSLKLRWNPLPDVDYYEIMFGGQIYANIRQHEFTFDQLSPATSYEVKIRSVKDMNASAWKLLNVKTAPDPSYYIIRGIKASAHVKSQAEDPINHLTDLDVNSLWHTDWENVKAAPWENNQAEPLDINLDLTKTYLLDKLEYLPRNSGINGTITKLLVSVSDDNKKWKQITDTLIWKRNTKAKTIEMPNGTKARYVRLRVCEAVGGFVSGREIYVYRRKESGK